MTKIIILILFITFSNTAFGANEQMLPYLTEFQIESETLPDEVHYCQDDQMRVQFLCNPDWIMEEDESGSRLIVISEDPLVTLTLAKEDGSVITLKDLTWPVLKEMGQYQDDYALNYVTVAGRDTINTEAIAVTDGDMRLSDFYMTRDGVLYTFLFAVKPKDQFTQVMPLIFNIMNSVQFLDEVRAP